MKLKKIQKKLRKKIVKILDTDPNSLGLVNFFYIFLITISLVYAGLFWSMAREIDREYRRNIQSSAPVEFQNKISNLTKGYPIERMAPFIASRDKKVATFLVSIAKKESNWGRVSPKKGGKECWNFWGYRGTYNQTASGYSCFDSPQQAVRVVGGRMQELVDQDLDTPRKIAVWKCGYDCSWDNPAQINKWVSDVGFYYQKIYE